MVTQYQLDSKYFEDLAKKYSHQYQTGDPFPHIYIDNVFPEEVLSQVLSEFPKSNEIDWIQYKTKNELKLASRDEQQFGALTRSFIHILNSKPFLTFLEELTGIKNLIPDPTLEGGGLHQILPGGLLKIHADFNKHVLTKLDRRLNVLIYLNKDWKEEYGGFFELWSKDMSKAEVKILPVFNRMAIFSTTSDSYHGHPDPLTCPDTMSRKSIAMYYYTNGRPADEVVDGLEEHNTIFKARAGTGETNKSFKETLKLFIPPIITNALKKK